jgi:hypothetical protein
LLLQKNHLLRVRHKNIFKVVKTMEHFVRHITCFLLTFIIIFFCTPVTVQAENIKEQKKTTIEVCEVKNDETKEPVISTNSLSLLSKRLLATKTKCTHKTESIVVPPTCTRYGYTVAYCKKCDSSYMSNFLPTSSHDFTEFNVTFEGEKELHRICLVCEYEEIGEEKQTSRYFSKKNKTETIWKSYKATLEERKIIETRLQELGVELKSSVIVENVPKYVWDFLMARINNPYGVAGIMGNLYAESGVLSTNLQNTYEWSLGHSDISYTNAVDNGQYQNFIYDSAGYGLAQWTSSDRKANLLYYANSTNRSIGDLDMQLEFLWNELVTYYPGLVAIFQNATSVPEAASAFMINFERPLDQSEWAQAVRASYSQCYFNDFANIQIVQN